MLPFYFTNGFMVRPNGIRIANLQVSVASLTSNLETTSSSMIRLDEIDQTTLDGGTKVLFVVQSRLEEGFPFCRGMLAEPSSTTQDELTREAVLFPLSDEVQETVLIQGAARLLDSLLLQHLILEREGETCATVELSVRIDSKSKNNHMKLMKHALKSRGYVADNNVDDETFRIDYGKVVRAYSELAISERGAELGLSALEILGLLSSRRIPYKFSEDPSATSSSTRNVVAVQRGLLPKEVTANVLDIMADIEAKGWLSTNLDSVDKLPSLHLNLVSGGEPIFRINDDDSSATTFEGSVNEIWLLVKPHLENELLRNVREIMGSPTVALTDVFIRRYGEDVQPDYEAATRFGISAHFDVTASTTSVIALDDVAAEGKCGLYTTDSSAASNHAALRRYFPLTAGDAVVHTWDILHGVEIDPGQSRTSLIVWFEDRGQEIKNAEKDASAPYTPVCPLWLANLSKNDDIGMFVLATATSSSSDDSLIEKGADDTNGDNHPHNLYILSAALGNAFALTSVGSLCIEGKLSPEHLSKVISIVQGPCGL